MKALLIIDLQNDFLPGGALAVTDGDRVIEPINKLMEQEFDLIVASKDWHPQNHVSFISSHEPQALWPDHCVQNSTGAEFPSQLHTDKIDKVILKGQDPEVDSYSAFFDNKHQAQTGLDIYLKNRHIDTVYIVGLALDYCVKFTALDAASLGYKTYVIQNATRAVNPKNIESVLTELKAAGVTLQ